MSKAKEEIQENLKNKEQRYLPIWKIIDERWDKQIQRPLHSAAYFLNPKFQYSSTFKTNMVVMGGFYDTMKRMVPDEETRVIIDKQMDMFRKAEGEFGRSMAIATREKKQPALWWESYGSHVPELQSIVMKILSITCSSSWCERNWSITNHIHSKKRNRLEQQRVNALTYIKCNLNLEMRNLKRQERGETYDPISLSDMESDDEWIADENSISEDLSWLDIHECFNISEGDPTTRKRRGPRDLRYNQKKNARVSTSTKGKEKVTGLVGEAVNIIEEVNPVEVQVVEDDEEEEDTHGDEDDDVLDDLDDLDFGSY